MIVTEIYTFVVVILKKVGVLDWSWVAILLPELVWLGVYAVSLGLFFLITAVESHKDKIYREEVNPYEKTYEVSRESEND